MLNRAVSQVCGRQRTEPHAVDSGSPLPISGCCSLGSCKDISQDLKCIDSIAQKPRLYPHKCPSV
jgi:hypothetical protein